MHSDNDLSIKTETHLSDKEDTSASEANSASLLTSPAISTSSSLSQPLVSTSSTQSIPVPITSTMLSYSSAAHINNYTAAVASMQAQAQAVHAAHQAAAVAQANQAAAASAQYTAHYTEAANLAKEVAQKNYANALKMAAVSSALTGKPLTALSYTGVALNKTGMLQQNQPYLTAGATTVAAPSVAPAYPPPRIGTPATPQQAMLPALTRPPPPIMTQAAYAHMLRPQMPASMVHNPYATAAAMAQHQLMNQSLMYPAYQAAGGYQFASPMHTAMPTANLTAIPGAIPQMQQIAANPASGSAMVLNPYKKMKTS
ncbi:uncharacterized protein LOC131692190 [Topomyia yanbarensis]|uniref:uncharacterized protein LOC131692190 n=1 Tax=Topomyia yanbarensis TaxID=2498891 RepID=UPI00273B7062|nr:uncharacterized protein LOC131692190 [Topomyia yanbarensis]